MLILYQQNHDFQLQMHSRKTKGKLVVLFEINSFI